MNTMESFLAQSRLGSWRWDIDSDSLTWTSEVDGFFGNVEVKGPIRLEQWSEFRAPEYIGRLREAFARCAGTGEPFCIEVEATRADGTPVRVDLHGAAAKDGNGKVTHLFGILAHHEEKRAVGSVLGARGELFASAFEHAAIGMALVAPDGRWLKVNRAICDMLGYSESELLEATFQDITYPEDLEVDLKYVRQMLAGERQTYQMEKRYFHKSGKLVWAILSVSLVRDAAGKPLNFISQVQDITLRRQIEAERDRFFNLSLDMLCVSGLDGYLRHVNPAWTRILGWSEEELMARPVFDLLHPEDLDATRAAREGLAAGLPLQDLENRYRCKDGSYRWLSWRSFSLPNEGTVFAVARDVTDRKLAEANLRQAAERLQLAKELAGMGVFDYDVATDTLHWDDQQCTIYGVEPGAGPPGLDRWRARLHPNDLIAAETAQFGDSTDPNKGCDITFRIVRGRDGAIRHLRSVARIERDSAGHPTRAVGMNLDITEDFELQENLRCAIASAEAANQAKSEFLAMMSHEIRTPMNAVIGYCDLLHRTPLTGEQIDFVTSIQHGGANLLEIIDSVLDFSKIEAGKLVLHSEPLDPGTLTEEVCNLLAVTARAKGLLFQTTISADIPRRILGDAPAIKRVLTNLLGNAIKFTEQGSVHLALSHRQDGAGHSMRMEVSDTGIGISKETLDRLFQPFSQGDTSHKRKFGGTGLGLIISRRLAEAMGGSVTAHSNPEGGSTFIFSFPCVEDKGPLPQLPEPPAHRGESTSHSPAGTRILLAEDNLVNQKLMLLLLRRLGFSCDTVENGREALDALERQHYDIVLLDIQMPVMDGWETAREIRRREAAEPGGIRTYLIAQSAYAMEADTRRCLEFGIDDHLTKPITIASLARALVRAPTMGISE